MPAVSELAVYEQGFSSHNGQQIISMPLHRDQTYQMGAGFGVVGSVRLAMYLLFTHLFITHSNLFI
jgi:hypothetical protein